MDNPKKIEARMKVLLEAEETYLLYAGWKKEGPDSWTAPLNGHSQNELRPGEVHVKYRQTNQAHAVNAQKQWDRFDTNWASHYVDDEEIKAGRKQKGE